MNKTRQSIIRTSRANILRIKRGMPNKHASLNAAAYIKMHTNEFKYYIAAGHGTLIRTTPAYITVPKNVWVIYTTRPGYFGLMDDTIDPKFTALFTDENRLKNLLKGTLPYSQRPDLSTLRKWNWAEQVYTPGSETPNFEITFIEDLVGTPKNIQTKIFTKHDKVIGMYSVPSSHRYFYGEQKTIKELMDFARTKSGSSPTILIISACRSDPETIPEMLEKLRIRNFTLNLPQRYSIPLKGNFVKQIQNREKKESKKVVGTNERVINRNISKIVKFVNGKPTQQSMNIIKRMYPSRFNSNRITREIRNLPSGSSGIPSKTNINRIASKYSLFFNNKNVNTFVRQAIKSKSNAATRIQARVRGMQVRSKQTPKNRFIVFISQLAGERGTGWTKNFLKRAYSQNYEKYMKILNTSNKLKRLFGHVTKRNLIQGGLSNTNANLALVYLNTSYT